MFYQKWFVFVYLFQRLREFFRAETYLFQNIMGLNGALVVLHRQNKWQNNNNKGK